MDYTDLPLDVEDSCLRVEIDPSVRVGAGTVVRVPHGARGPFTVRLEAGVTVGQRVIFDFTELVCGSATTPRTAARMESPTIHVGAFAVIGHDSVVFVNAHVPAGVRILSRMTLHRPVPSSATFLAVNADLKTGSALVTANSGPIRALLIKNLADRRPSDGCIEDVRAAVARGDYDQALDALDPRDGEARVMLHDLYAATRGERTDIQYHLPFLAALARRGGSVLECGIREGVSTVAFVKGLLETDSPSYTGVDIDAFALTNANVQLLKTLAARGARIDMDLRLGSSLRVPLPESKFAVIFIDTLHVYGLLLRELRRYAPLLTDGGVFVLHDTESDGIDGEIVRLAPAEPLQGVFLRQMMEANPEIADRGEFLRGLLPAVHDFCREASFRVLYQSSRSSGLTVIGRAASEAWVREALEDAYGGESSSA